jgi:two-component system chemotaxis sensor kinase CheA
MRMNPILEQFLSESRDFLEGIAARLMQLESAPDDAALMSDLFRLVHTLKGNTGLFDFPEMARVLHAAEDLMTLVRDGGAPFTQALADCLLDAMDFVSMLLDDIERSGAIGPGHGAASMELAAALRRMMPQEAPGADEGAVESAEDAGMVTQEPVRGFNAALVPEAQRMTAWRALAGDATLYLVRYTPEPECFFKGEDPLHLARQAPGLLWKAVSATEPWPDAAVLDPYRCILAFDLLCIASREALEEHFRYVAEQTGMVAVPADALVLPLGYRDTSPVHADFADEARKLLDDGDIAALRQRTQSLAELCGPETLQASALRWLALLAEHDEDDHAALRRLIDIIGGEPQPHAPAAMEAGDNATANTVTTAVAVEDAGAAQPSDAVRDILAAQREVLALADDADWLPGRLRAVAATLSACCAHLRQETRRDEIAQALEAALLANSGAPLLSWLDAWNHRQAPANAIAAPEPSVAPQSAALTASGASGVEASANAIDGERVNFGRRAEDGAGSIRTLKVEQTKVDRLMNLIGEMVVAKNALPYLAARAEETFHVRELAREIKAQYAVINRISEDMQDAIMQVRMMPVSFIFQRFPRVVRDISRRLGKEVNLALEGEDTEADKNIIEALADPLIHIVRNSLDHGIETPDERVRAGKPAAGTLTIRAAQEADRVVIEIHDDGRGIDPVRVRAKACERGLLSLEAAERLSDAEAVNLVFAAGFSTAETVSDLSGRGVGMDVVRAAVEKVHGSVTLNSEAGRGTRVRLSLPLSMAVSRVMIVESDGQIFGMPMDAVVETVRVPASSIHRIKQAQATVLRGRIVPLRSLNELLATQAPQCVNDEEEYATLIVRANGEQLGIVVDDFREVADIILKPLTGILGSLSGYAGSAPLGDGSVLMVLNPKELV